ncbi:hypothetical protein CAPTEDRAFT_212618 [Capitella teleta]|uniref:Methyltransferase type 12 domain-containing protein n=1 Tax=Capitella teleta TaxID=283909 RepID=R7U8H9_CAPTE|nr:hypothetical protein CAPTEDRAFT_212618 [Capitella teleta]|eukprot:ELT99996.1 hypothetical protein CAPTEDRAFT_212618 [Capitella teleta]
MDAAEYEAALTELLRRSLFPQRFYEVVAQYREVINGVLGLAETCLSIGPGAGDVDIFLIRMFIPNLKEFHGVEVNRDLCRRLKNNMKTLQQEIPDLEVTVHREDAQVWKGLDHKVDVIFCFDTLYNFTNTESVLRKLQSWLKPNGVQWCTFTDSRFLTHEMRFEFKINRGDLLSVSVADINAHLGYRNLVDIKYEAGLCLRGVNKTLLKVLLLRTPTDYEMEQFENFVQVFDEFILLFFSPDIPLRAWIPDTGYRLLLSAQPYFKCII